MRQQLSPKRRPCQRGAQVSYSLIRGAAGSGAGSIGESAEAAIRVSDNDFQLTLHKGKLSDETIEFLREAGRRRQAPEFVDETLALLLVSSAMNRWLGGRVPPILPQSFFRYLLKKIAADAVCGIGCGILARVLRHEGSAG